MHVSGGPFFSFENALTCTNKLAASGSKLEASASFEIVLDHGRMFLCFRSLTVAWKLTRKPINVHAEPTSHFHSSQVIQRCRFRILTTSKKERRHPIMRAILKPHSLHTHESTSPFSDQSRKTATDSPAASLALTRNSNLRHLEATSTHVLEAVRTTRITAAMLQVEEQAAV
jgi:hypothetical protein